MIAAITAPVAGSLVTRRLRAMGIRDKPTAPASPWQNGVAERLIRSIGRECVDHIIVFSEAQLHRILTLYAAYYNSVKTHRSLDKDAPVSRPVQRTVVISSRAIQGGLHHHYTPCLSFQYTQGAWYQVLLLGWLILAPIACETRAWRSFELLSGSQPSAWIWAWSDPLRFARLHPPHHPSPAWVNHPAGQDPEACVP